MPGSWTENLVSLLGKWTPDEETVLVFLVFKKNHYQHFTAATYETPTCTRIKTGVAAGMIHSKHDSVIQYSHPQVCRTGPDCDSQSESESRPSFLEPDPPDSHDPH